MTDRDHGDELSARIAEILGRARRHTDKADMPFGLLTIVQATDGEAAERLAVMMRGVAAALRLEPGNLLYTVNRDDDGLTFYLHDRGKSLAAVHEHQETKHFRDTIEEFDILARILEPNAIALRDDQ